MLAILCRTALRIACNFWPVSPFALKDRSAPSFLHFLSFFYLQANTTMPGDHILRNWFVPGEGIARQVISADIQRYLGNDATVRPGTNTVDEEEVCIGLVGSPSAVRSLIPVQVSGYWIRAYRNLTTVRA